ncbi:phage tail protein [Salinicola sp. DM10]|uniref:phage tail protein n=1 Tax=Salinicola sp. DM10 TaxID=2815721 RepID=UPI001A8DB454|nr:tail fiber protein [Salinicola sp. DM10]MCE3025388.1 tail fiber protein [Salinicola sp. DM10]
MSDPFLGEIKMFGGNYTPQGYAMCQGQIMAIAQNDALYAVLGTLYGGNGTTTFGLPNFQGRSPVGMGTGTGLQPVAQAATGGAETVTLSNDNIPAFSLSITGVASIAIPASTEDGSAQLPGNSSVLAKPVDAIAGAEVSLYNSAANTTLAPFTAPVQATATHTAGSVPVGIRTPYLGTNFIIALTGVFPVRSN